jgi:putative ABC transport system permease protein
LFCILPHIGMAIAKGKRVEGDFMYELIRDLRQAIRGFRKSPGTTAIIIVALALGIGVNVSSFIFLEGVVLHPLPFPQLDRLMIVWESPAGMAGTREGIAPANYLDLKERSQSFQFLGAYREGHVNLTGGVNSESIQACLATPEFFYALGSNPAMGRTFREDDGEPGRDNVAIVSHGFWRQRLGGRSDIAGTKLSLNGAAFTIVGVMPASFNYPLETEIWTPLAFTTAERHDRESRSLALLGRLNPAVSGQQARSEAHAIARQLAFENPEVNENVTNEVTNRFLMIFQVTAGFVLLLAAANVANLLLVRLAARQREMAIRTAMGATRGRIIRLLMAEAVLIALAAGGLGLYLASWNLTLTHWMMPAEVYKLIAGLKEIHINIWAVLFTLVVSLIGALLCVAPALAHALRGGASESVNDALKEGGRCATAGRARTRMRTVLAISEVAIAMILLVGAGVMVRTFKTLLKQNPGYDTANLLTMKVSLQASDYPGAPQYSAFYRRVLQGLNQMGTAKSAAVESFLGYAQGLYIEGRPDPRPDKITPQITSVSGDYFRTLRLPLIQGRVITDRDDNDFQPVVVLSESVVRNYWPDSNPIGARVRMSKKDGPWLTVVGVCGDVKNWFFSWPEPRAYVSYLQIPSSYASILVRTQTAPEHVARAARAEILKVDRALSIFDVKSMEQQIVEQTSGVRASAISMTTYALIAMFLAVSGIYAVISYSVAQRMHEIGVRMALGASRSAVLKMTLAEAARVGAIGLGIGIPLALGLIRLLSSVLYGVIQTDAATFATIAVIMGASALAAGYVPALRAARVDPITALRNE